MTDRSVISVPTVTPARTAAKAGAPPRAQRQRRKNTRAGELLDAALALFVERGYAATRTDDVARRAGVSKGTLYLYYDSKEALFKAAVSATLGRLITEGLELAAGFQGPTDELLRTLVQTWWERVGDTPAAGIHKVVLSEVGNFPELAQFYTDEVIVPADRLFAGAVERGVARGEFRPLPPHEVALALMAPMIFIALHRHSIGACPVHGAPHTAPHQVLQTHLDLVLRGLRAEPAAAAPAAATRRRRARGAA
jgi:AcrR family transcriptional regulator